jgi:hypothetical protein
MKVKYFDKNNLSELGCNDGADAQYARSVLVPLIENGVSRYFANVDCEMALLSVEGKLIPISITDSATQEKRSYVCSPIAHYIDYGLREVDIEFPQKPVVGAILKSIIRAFRFLFVRPNFDKVVMVNNWLLSTNLYPEVSEAAVDAISEFLIQKFPDHAVLYRSVNPELNSDIMQKLVNAKFQQVLSRQVYLLDVATGDYKKRRAYKIDRKLERRTNDFCWTAKNSISSSDIPRIKELYDSLYIRKYAKFNPQLTIDFFSEALARDWLDLWVLREKETDRIVAVIGYFARQGVMTTPVIGYDPAVPTAVGLYRLITLKIIEQSVATGNFLHMSSGAAHFKRLRGGASCFEYNMVYFRHLRFARRLPWMLLAWLTRWIAQPVFRWFKL